MPYSVAQGATLCSDAIVRNHIFASTPDDSARSGPGSTSRMTGSSGDRGLSSCCSAYGSCSRSEYPRGGISPTETTFLGLQLSFLIRYHGNRREQHLCVGVQGSGVENLVGATSHIFPRYMMATRVEIFLIRLRSWVMKDRSASLPDGVLEHIDDFACIDTSREEVGSSRMMNWAAAEARAMETSCFSRRRSTWGFCMQNCAAIRPVQSLFTASSSLSSDNVVDP